MPKQTAGILLYRKAATGYEVLLVHPGGPFWAKKDKGSWSMPKGEFEPDEAPFDAAKREFKEEVGLPAPDGDYTPLTPVKVTSSKIAYAFVREADIDLTNFTSNSFEMEWPPKSGQTQTFPENDKAAWVPLTQAAQKLVKGQVPLIDQLMSILGTGAADDITPASGQASLF